MEKMKIVDLVQGSPEWLESRRSGIGASDIGAIMGVCQYRDARDVYDDKIGEGKPFFVSDAVKHGNAQEPLAREWLEKQLATNLESVCAEHEELDYFKCSFDAINEDRSLVIEIKSPFNKTNVEKYKKIENVPLSYIYQVQWQIMIAEVSFGFLCIWDGQEGFLHEIQADKKLHKNMVKEGDAFWKRVLLRDPPPMKHQDLSHDNMELKIKSELVIEAIKRKKEAESIIKEHSTELKEVGKGSNFLLHGLKYTVCPGRASYDFDAMKEDGIDIEKYAKVGKDYYKNSIVN